MNASYAAGCLTYERVMPRIWMSHVSHMYASCHTCERIVSHIWMSHVSHMNESCLTYGWVVSHIWMSRVVSCSKRRSKRRLWRCKKQRDVVFHKQKDVAFWMSRVSHMNESRRVVQQKTIEEEIVNWIVNCSQSPSSDVVLWMSHVTWLIHTCDMTHSYLWHDSFTILRRST